MEDELCFDDDFAGLEVKYNWSSLDKFLKESAVTLAELDSEQKLKIIRRILNMSNYDDVDLHSLVAYELQNSSEAAALMKEKPTMKPVAYPLDVSKQDRLASGKRPLIIRFKVKNASVKSSALKPSKEQERLSKKQQPIKPIIDEYKMVQKSGEVNLKRPRTGREDGDDEEEKKKKRAKTSWPPAELKMSNFGDSLIGEGLKNPVLAAACSVDVGRERLKTSTAMKSEKKSLALKKPSVKQLGGLSKSKEERLLKEKQGKKPMTDDEYNFMMVKKKFGRKAPLKWPCSSTDSQACRPPAELKEKIKQQNGSEEILVIQKRLLKSDLSLNNVRLSLPSTLMNPEFPKHLTPEEKAQLNVRIGKDIPGIEAGLIKPSGHKSTICLKKWDMISGSILNLVTGWKEVLKENENEWCEGMIVQVWSFRVGSKLWFAVLII